MIDITGIDKARLLAALYNRARAEGMGYLFYDWGRTATVDQARKLLKERTQFDYISGRTLKVDLTSDTEFDPGLYDRDNGQGAAQRVVDGLRGADAVSVE